MRTHRGGLAALLVVTAVWGTTFPAMKQLSGDLGALDIIAIRFLISSCILLPLAQGLRAAELRWGVAIGAVLFAAFYLQVSGLAQTTSNRNAFVTGLNVLIVPLLALLLGQRLGWPLVLGACLAVLGLGGLFYEQAPWSAGDTLTLAGAVVYAVYVLTFEFCARATRAPRPERLALVQSWTVMGLGLMCLAFTEPSSAASLWSRAQGHWAALLYLGIAASALMVWLQAWGQQRVRAVDAAMVYGLEPVFAAAAAVWWVDEVLRGRALAGAALIVLSVLLSQIPTTSRTEPPRAT